MSDEDGELTAEERARCDDLIDQMSLRRPPEVSVAELAEVERLLFALDRPFG